MCIVHHFSQIFFLSYFYLLALTNHLSHRNSALSLFCIYSSSTCQHLFYECPLYIFRHRASLTLSALCNYSPLFLLRNQASETSFLLPCPYLLLYTFLRIFLTQHMV